MANASQTRMAYVAESTWGTTPATPSFTNARFTGEAINANIDSVTSNEIRPDRNVSDLIQVGSSAGGALSFELSYGSYDDFMESVLYSSWSTDVLKNGNTEKSFTLEKTFETGVTDQYHRFAGSVAGSMSLSCAVGAIVTGSFEFLSKGTESAQAEIAGATYGGASTTEVINAAADFASLTMTGVSSPELTALDVTITNNLRTQQVLGSIDARGIATGRFEVSGTFTAYFKNEEIYELFLANTAADLSFKLGGASSQNYVFDMPNIKFGSANVVAGGNDQDLLVEVEFTALYDSGEDATLKITRTA